MKLIITQESSTIHGNGTAHGFRKLIHIIALHPQTLTKARLRMPKYNVLYHRVGRLYK